MLVLEAAPERDLRPSTGSLAFPMLTPQDVLDQMRLAEELAREHWYKQLRRWVRKEIVPRSRAGG